MSSEQKQMTAQEILAQGWHLTLQSMALSGMEVPSQCRVTAPRVATLDELKTAVDAIDKDIERWNQETRCAITVGDDIERLLQAKASLPLPERPGRSYIDWCREKFDRKIEELRLRLPTEIARYVGRDIEELEKLRSERAWLLELRRRAGRTGCPGSTTVIEALFPDVPVKKKTAEEKAEIEQWLAARREAGLKIDPETAEVTWWYAQTLDPYGVRDEWSYPKNLARWVASVSRAPQGAIFGSFLRISPPRPVKPFMRGISANLCFLLALKG